MVIKRSSAAETQRLVADLVGDDAMRREAAAARLAIIGPRTLDRLQELLVDGAKTADLLSVLSVLERIGDERSAQMARPWLEHTAPEVAAAAVAVVRTQLLARRASASTPALEALTTIVLDAGRHEAVRVAALDALHDLSPDVVAPLLDRLQADPSRVVRHRAGHGTALVEPATGAGEAPGRTPSSDSRAEPQAAGAEAGPARRGTRGRRRGENDPGQATTPAPAHPGGEADQPERRTWSLAATDAGLPDDPSAVREAVAREAAEAPLSLLHRLVVALAAKERTATPAGGRAEWRAVRGAVHQALAERGSRVALYDLRESLERDTEALPVGMLAALERIGDAACLEPMADYFARGDDAWQRERLREAATAIIRRERLTRRSAILKRVEAKAGTLLN